MSGWIQIIVYMVVLVACSIPLGIYIAQALEGQKTFLKPVLGWLENLIYKLSGINPERNQDWKGYAIAAILFNGLGALVVYMLQRAQASLPLNPAHQGAVSADLSFSTAMSFVTNTNWQSYGGESTMSYLTQMVALGVQNFLSAATGIAVLVALIRGIRSRESSVIGNFWVDMTRSVVYVLLPLSVVFSLVLVQQGVVQTFDQYATAKILNPVQYDNPVLDAAGQPVNGPDGKPKTEKATMTDQSIALGPVASQEAIKQLGTNGGGFFNVNSAHPFENPTPLTNFLECLAILLIPAALCFTFGEMIRDRRQGYVLFAAMTLLFLLFVIPCVASEQSGNPIFKQAGLTTNANWEGKELRVGIENSALWASATTAASNGSVNSMHDSYTPVGGMMPMFLIMLGEVIYGGVGSGLYGMLIFAIIAVFIAGLMVGRTPEYLGKKIEPYEMKMASFVILIPCCLALLATALPLVTGAAQSSMSNPGAHGFSQVLYNYSSMANNNGSAFAGFNANVPFHNDLGGLIMWMSRYWLIVPILAIAGSLAKKKVIPVSVGTLPTHTPLFVGLLCGTVLLVGALTFIPALALGPIVEHLQMVGAH